MNFFGNFEEDDALTLALKNPSALKQPSSKALKLSKEDQLDLERAREEVRKLEEEEQISNSKRSFDRKPAHFSHTDQNFAQKKRKVEKNDEFDDILSALDAIEGNEKPKSRTETQGFTVKAEKKQGSHDFFGDLEENFQENGENLEDFAHKPAKPLQTFSKTAQSFAKTPIVTPPHEELKSRRANLFGLSKEMSARGSENNSNNQSFSRNAPQNPSNNDNLAIGTVDFGGVSRRKNQKTLSSHTSKERPFTSPGAQTQATGDFLESLSKNANANANNNNFNENMGKKLEIHVNEENDELAGEYIPSMGSNRGFGKPPISRKLTNPPSQNSPALSQKGFNYERVEERTEKFDKISIENNFENKSKGDCEEIPRRKNEELAKNLRNFSENAGKLNNFPAATQALPKENVLDLLSNKKTAEIDEFRGLIENIKKNYEEQIRVLKENQREELEFERKSKQKYIEDSEKQAVRDLERTKESYESEAKRKDELHKFELDQLRRKYELEIDSLKREIDQQVKLSSLTTEIQRHSAKLFDISDKLDLQKREENYEKTGEIYKREQILQENERNFQKTLESFENDKRRLDFARQEFDNERSSLRKEYKRLEEFQNMLKLNEHEKFKELSVEKARFLKEKEQFDREKQQFLEEIALKTKQHEQLCAVFEAEKQQIFALNESFQENYRRKLEDVEKAKAKAAQLEAELLRKRTLLEKKELELSKAYDSFATKSEKLRAEQRDFEAEARKVFEIAGEVQKESDFLNNFKRNFDFEKQKLQRKRLELDTFAQLLENKKHGIQREKLDLRNKTQVIENLRFEIVKEFEKRPEIVKEIDVFQEKTRDFPQKNSDGKEKNREYLGKNKENSKALWNIVRKEGGNTRDLQGTERSSKKLAGNSLNLEEYMGFLKKINEENAENQAYISREQAILQQKK